MKRSVCILAMIILISISNSLFAQKWGKVSKDILKMTSIPEDSEADAVILFEKCDMKITAQFELEQKIHRRIKILTERGLKYADISFSYWHEDNISRLKAHTILPNGKKIKLKKKQIFNKQDRLWKEKVFTFSGVEVGSVIEYKYEKCSQYLTSLEPWYFQNQEFTKLSQLSVIIPSGFN